MSGLAFWTAAVLASMLVGMAKGGLPVVGMLGVPILSLVISPLLAVGLLLPVYIVSDMFGLYAYRKAFDRRLLAILIPASTIGIAMGWATASIVSERMVTLLVGLIGASFALNLLLRAPKTEGPRVPQVMPGLFWGSLSGFTSFVSHAGSPPYQVYVLPLGLEKTIFAGTTTILFTYVNAAKLLPYWALGQLSVESLKTAAILFVPASSAVFIGVWLVRILPQTLFFRLVTWALLAVSVKLLWDSVIG